MKKSAVVIIPTTGNPSLIQAIYSLSNQTYENIKVIVVIDGHQYRSAVNELLRYSTSLPENINIVCLAENVGANGFYGHRIYGAFSYLINQDYVFFLDQDNWFEPNHIESMINKLEETDSHWVYSLRNICGVEGNFIAKDNCESLGKWEAWTNCNHIDTNCYCLRKDVAITIAPAWYGGWGQDRVVFGALQQYFPKFECTSEYTVNYRLDGNEGSVTREFFEQGNYIMYDKFDGKFPWSK
jgi:glycosyltransferase involved in cell wall biosynthesis